MANMTADINLTCKYASEQAVLRAASPTLRDILESAPVASGAGRTVDVKVQELSPGQYTCIPGWHSDTKGDPNAIHHLYVVGENRTEFLEPDGSVNVIPNATWKTYGSDLHRGPRVKIGETRLLIRVTESDMVKGNANIIKLG